MTRGGAGGRVSSPVPLRHAHHVVLFADAIAFFKAHGFRLREIKRVGLAEKTIKARFVEKENDLHWPGVRHRHLVYSVHRHEDEITGADGDILFVDRGRARATDYIPSPEY